ncbi:MAG: tetratricopeptide repeat protein [Verrucomicrobia bacterium]|nr:tetratricopeptide repeat protein [Verrucomicrobiota bacterium]
MTPDPTLAQAMQDARQGRLSQAIQNVRRVVQRQPKNADALQVLAFLLTQAGQAQQALHFLQQAIQVAPEVPAFRNNLGTALVQLGRFAEARPHFEKAIELDLKYPMPYLGLSFVCTTAQDSAAALRLSELGLQLRPGWPELMQVRASALEAADRLDEALATLDELIRLRPSDPALRPNRLMALNYTCRPARELFAAAREYHALCPPAPAWPVEESARERPLRVGVLSSDLRTHSVAFFLEALLHSRPNRWTLIAFSNSTPSPKDPLTQRLRPRFDEWIETVALDDAALDEAIRGRRIDVLLELNGHTTGGRLSALQRKPAPLIVSALGYPNTTGHPAVDLRLVDSITDPPGAEAFCTERLLRVDPCFLCYTPPADAPAPALPPEDAPLTFGSFNFTAKLSAPTIALWAQCLAAAPGSRLLLKAKSTADPSHREHLLARLEAGGIDPARVELLAYTRTMTEHLGLYGRVHVALDPTPYNGTTTTCEALWMGVPVVTLAGDRHAARVGASLLHALGREEWVASDASGYIGTAVRLATDRAELARLRTALRPQMAASPLTDAAAYSARVFAALAEAWRSRSA